MLRLENCLIENGSFRLSADISIATGKAVAVIGPSGAGKSTLLEAIAGFRDLITGSILWNETTLSAITPGARPIATLFQDGNLFPHLTVAQNIALGIRPSGKLSKSEVQQTHTALDRVGLAGMNNRNPAELSGGQQSRAALARVLVQRRDILLLDEPFAALGPALKVEMLDLVKQLISENGTTLLMVSHDPNDALRITDHTIFVADQGAHQPVATQDLFSNPPAALKDYLVTHRKDFEGPIKL